MSNVERLRDEQGRDEGPGNGSGTGRSSLPSSRAGSRPASGRTHQAASRRGSLQALVRPASGEHDPAAIHEAIASPSIAGGEGEVSQEDADVAAAEEAIAEQIRQQATSPLPGAIEDDQSGAAGIQAHSSLYASTSSKRRSGVPRYTTTLAEDDARDRYASEVAASAIPAEHPASEEDQRPLQRTSSQSQSRREVHPLPAHASSTGIASLTHEPSRSRQQAHRRKGSKAVGDVDALPNQASFASPDFATPDEAAADSARRRASASQQKTLSHQGSASEIGGRQRRKHHPDDEAAATEIPSQEEQQQQQQQQEHHEPTGEPDEQEQPHDAPLLSQHVSSDAAIRSTSSKRGGRRVADSAALAGSSSKSQLRQSALAASNSKSQLREPSKSKHSAHGEEIPPEEVQQEEPLPSPSADVEQQQDEEQPLASPSAVVEDEIPAEEPAAVVEAEPERPATPDSPLPVFTRLPRKYAQITDPAKELARIRKTKEYEVDLEDIVLPTFQSEPPGEESQRTVRGNPLKEAYDEVHGVIDEESAQPVMSVDPSTLLNDILGVGRLSLDEVARMEAELEAERLEDMQAEMQRAARRELELSLFQHSLLAAHEQTADSHKKELSEREHQLLQSTRLLMKEEQESFRRSEDKMRAWLLRNKSAVLNTEMQDLIELAKEELKTASPEDKSGEAEDNADGDNKKELKERGAAGDKSTTSPTGDSTLESQRTEIHDLYARVRSRKYDIKWNYEPRLIRIRLDWLRCLKNKLPLGNYNIMVTLYDRLGGDALRWTGGTDQQQRATCFSHTGSTTIPQRHGGRFYNLELNFHQRANRIFLACPSMLLSRPSMVFVFELFLMGDASATGIKAGVAAGQKRSSILQLAASGAAGFAAAGSALAGEMLLKARDPKQYALLKAAQANAKRQALQRAPPSSDRVVAWGAFPMSYINFEIIRGRFKLPMIRGAYGEEPIEKFATVHEKIAENLDQWLGNLYFQVKHWPRLLDHERENHVSLHFKGKKLTEDGESSDEEEEDDDGDEELQIDQKTGALLLEKDGLHQDATDAAFLSSLEPDILVLDDGTVSRAGGEKGKGGGVSAPQNSQRGPRTSAADRHVPAGAGSAANPGDLRIDLDVADGGDAKSGKTGKKGKGKKVASSDGGAQHAAVTSTERRMKIKFHSRRHPGMLLDYPDMDDKVMAELRNQKKRAELCSKYRYNVNLNEGTDEEEGTAAQANNPLGRRAAYKMRYIAHEVWADLGVKKFSDWQFFFFFIVASLWVRIYTHYLGQYLFLSSIYIPITKYACKVYTCDIQYVWDPLAISAQIQIGVVVIGVLTNMIIMALMIATISALQRTLGRTPAWASRLILGWGCGTIVEPFLIMLIDACQHNWYGDSFKLYQYYLTKDGNGVSGIFMTILLTLMLVTISVVMFYFYVIKIHMNGRILDVHYRLHGGASLFYIPHDLEISVRELRWILIKARRWVGMGGQKRKVAVSKFKVRDPLRPAKQQDVSIYIAIYTQSLNGDIELFRHFLRNPSGSIVEIFDSFDIPGEAAFKRIEEKLQAHDKRQQQLQMMVTNEFSSKLTGLSGGLKTSLNLKPSLTMSTDASMRGGNSPRLGPSILSKQHTPRDLLSLGRPPGTPGGGALAGKSRLKAISQGLTRGDYNKLG